MLTYNLQLAVIERPWRHNNAGVAYCYEQEPMGFYDDRLVQWVALVDVLNRELWDRIAPLAPHYGGVGRLEILLPRLTDDDAIPRIVLRYDVTIRRYLIYSEGTDNPSEIGAMIRLADALKLARKKALVLVKGD